MENDEILQNLPADGSRETVLREATLKLMAKLQTHFGSEYVISSDDFATPDKDWSNEIKIRKGSKIGASVSMKWENSAPNSLKLSVDESSKLGNIITYGILLSFIAIGAYMGHNHIFPLHFLPGRKIAAGLGGLLAALPGMLLVFVIKAILFKGEKAENAKLVQDVKKAIQ
jgi:hypothetical protein